MTFKLSLLTAFLLSVFLTFDSEGGQATSMLNWSGEDKKWHGTLNGEFKGGNSRSISTVGFTLPVMQTRKSLIISDFRGKFATTDTQEVNLGIVYRTIVQNNWILGAYLYYDYKESFTNNNYHGGTIGGEVLNEDWDFRVNGYLAETGGMDAGPTAGFGTRTLSNGTIFQNNQRLEERAYHGLDFEVGKLLATFGENDNEIRAYIGGFFFENDAPGFPSISGPRGRVEMRLFDCAPFGEGSRVTLLAELQHDNVRDTEFYGGIHVQVPLGGTHGKSNPFGASSGYSKLSRLERRMLDPVVRDIDIVTYVGTSGDPNEPVGTVQSPAPDPPDPPAMPL